MALSNLKSSVSDKEEILSWLFKIGERDQEQIDFIINECTYNKEAREFYTMMAKQLKTY